MTLPSECVSLNGPGFEDQYSSSSVVVAVGMWESASSISKVCGKGGKQHSSFSGLSTDRHFHGLPHVAAELSCSDLLRCIHPVLLELDRAEVVQRRVHPCLVIPEQPCDGFILGLADRFKALAMQPLHLQRTEQRLRASVIPAVTLAAHRWRDCAVFKHLSEVLTGILATAIAMEDQPCLLAWIAPEPGHLQRIDDQIAMHVRPHRPAHHLAAE